MRIAITTETFLPKVDGIVTMVTQTVACLRAAGHEVLLFAPSGGPTGFHGAEVAGLPSVPFPLYPELRLAAPRASMRARLEAFRPDVLHLFEPSLLGIGGLYFGRVLKIPTVVSYHTNLPAYLRHYHLGLVEGLTWKLLRERHGRADLNLCTSQAMVDDLARHGIDRLALWQRAVDAERFHPGARCEATRAALTGGEPGAPLLLSVCRLSAEKDVGSLRPLLDAIPGARLAIVGDGPMRAELERAFRGTATIFAGYLHGEALAKAYASADVFLMPSRTETLGLVLLEAMASGCAVVACNAGGVPDAVTDGVTGFLYDPDMPGALAGRVQEVLAQAERRRVVCLRARAEVETLSWSRATAQLCGLYTRAMEDRRPEPIPKHPDRNAMGFGAAPGRFARKGLRTLARRLLP